MPWEKNFNKFGFPAGFNNFDAQRFSSTYYMFFLKKKASYVIAAIFIGLEV